MTPQTCFLFFGEKLNTKSKDLFGILGEENKQSHNGRQEAVEMEKGKRKRNRKTQMLQRNWKYIQDPVFLVCVGECVWKKTCGCSLIYDFFLIAIYFCCFIFCLLYFFILFRLNPCGASLTETVAQATVLVNGPSQFPWPLSPSLRHQMTLDMLVSRGNSGSMALLVCASSRLGLRGDLFCGRCPFSRVMGMLQ